MYVANDGDTTGEAGGVIWSPVWAIKIGGIGAGQAAATRTRNGPQGPLNRKEKKEKYEEYRHVREGGSQGSVAERDLAILVCHGRICPGLGEERTGKSR